MPPKKQKAQKMALNEFFANTPAAGASWADDMDMIPTAPSLKSETGPKRGEPGYLDSMPDRGARSGFAGPPRADVPIPSAPPYTAHVANLGFETTEEELSAFFGEHKPISTRLIKDADGKSKGFGYVEFASAAELEGALGLGMSQLAGRTVRVSVAEPPANRRDLPPSHADESSQWRRATPLSPSNVTDQSSTRRSTNYPSADQPDRDWGAARGARFVPAPAEPIRRDSSGYGFSRERESREGSMRGTPRDLTPSAADDAGQWRSARPLAEPISTAATAGGSPAGTGSPSLADTEATWSRGTKVRAAPADEQEVSSPLTATATASAADDRVWRKEPTPAAQATETDAIPPTPVERKKLVLAPRSTPSAVPASESTQTPPSSADSRGLFGSAKPVDSASRERAAEEKIAQRSAQIAEERRKKREEEEKAKREEEEKGRLLMEEKARKLEEIKRKAMREAGLEVDEPKSKGSGEAEGGAGSGAARNGEGAARGGRGGRGGGAGYPGPARGGQGGGGMRGGPPRRGSTQHVSGVRSPLSPTGPAGSLPPHPGHQEQHGQHQPSPQQHQHQQQQQQGGKDWRRPSRSDRSGVVPATEDGFEAPVTRGKRAARTVTGAGSGAAAGGAEGEGVKPKKAGFSFAAAAGMLDDEEADGEERNGEGTGPGAAVDEVTEGVEKVQV